MDIKIGFTKELTNTSYAPLAALFAHYQLNNLLEPLQQVAIPMQTRDFDPHSKLKQVLVSILAGCETLSEVNPNLKQEHVLAQVLEIPRITDQSGLSRTLDALTLKLEFRTFQTE
jgi:deoxyribodipyrimidine photolyase